MRCTVRLLAAAVAGKSPAPARYLTPGTPTGLTGLVTHTSPRSTLLLLYRSTLEKLRQLPEQSVYRRSTENLTRHRMDIMESIKPAGWDEWAAKASETIKAHPEQFQRSLENRHALQEVDGGAAFVETKAEQDLDEQYEQEWGGEEGMATLEGSRSETDARRNAVRANLGGQASVMVEDERVKWEDEPPLTVDQINEAEERIGAGLLEEVIEVAKGELKLVDVMAGAQVWDGLEEAPPEGQWAYFERASHRPSTQAPPSKAG